MNELQNKEFSSGSGLVLYDFNARTYDPQIGRFIQIDPLSDGEGQERITPYHFGLNNPVKNSDPTGKCPNCLVGAIIGFAVDAAIQISTSVAVSIYNGETPTVRTVWRDFNGAQSLAATGAGAMTSGLSATHQAGASLTMKTVAVNGTFSIWKQAESNNGQVNPSDLLIDVLPIPEGPSRKLLNTSAAEKAVTQADNSIASTTGRIPQRKLNALNEAQSTLTLQNEINAKTNQTIEALKAGSITTSLGEAKKVVGAVDKSYQDRSSIIPINRNAGNPTPGDNTRVVRRFGM